MSGPVRASRPAPMSLEARSSPTSPTWERGRTCTSRFSSGRSTPTPGEAPCRPRPARGRRGFPGRLSQTASRTTVAPRCLLRARGALPSAGGVQEEGACPLLRSNVRLMQAKAPPPVVRLSDDDRVTLEELNLAGRNHSMPLEALRHDITPVGLHYLLTHFDIPAVDLASWRLQVRGRVKRQLDLDLDYLRSLPAAELAVTLECAGNGRARLLSRPLSQPWLGEAVGTAIW